MINLSLILIFFLFNIVAIAQDNYPEMLSKVYIVNAPWIFNPFWWIIKNILPAR